MQRCRLIEATCHAWETHSFGKYRVPCTTRGHRSSTFRVSPRGAYGVRTVRESNKHGRGNTWRATSRKRKKKKRKKHRDAYIMIVMRLWHRNYGQFPAAFGALFFRWNRKRRDFFLFSRFLSPAILCCSCSLSLLFAMQVSLLLHVLQRYYTRRRFLFFLSLSRISTLTVLLYFSPLLSSKKDSSSILRENAWRCFLRCLKFYFSSEKGAFFPPKIYPLASLLIFSKRPQNFSQLFENLHASIILFHDFFNSPRLSLPRALYIF